MALTGEQIQQQGADGSQRAKRWLEATCRAEVKWNNPGQGVNKLQYRKAGAPAGSTVQGDFFSFDLGGNLLGGAADGNTFAAEVKQHNGPNDQGVEYRYFLAKCYRVEDDSPQMFDHYIWLTWAPFLVNSWKQLTTEVFVAGAVEHDDDTKRIALGDAALDQATSKSVADKLIIVVLSDRQEALLSLHGDELIGVKQALIQLRST